LTERATIFFSTTNEEAKIIVLTSCGFAASLFAIGLFIGLLLGSTVGWIAAALIIAGHKADHELGVDL
jgi:hypothetical protein